MLDNGGLPRDIVTWMNAMTDNAAELKVRHGGTPQHVSFRTWVNRPANGDFDAGTTSWGVYGSHRDHPPSR